MASAHVGNGRDKVGGDPSRGLVGAALTPRNSDVTGRGRDQARLGLPDVDVSASEGPSGTMAPEWRTIKRLEQCRVPEHGVLGYASPARVNRSPSPLALAESCTNGASEGASPSLSWARRSESESLEWLIWKQVVALKRRSACGWRWGSSSGGRLPSASRGRPSRRSLTAGISPIQELVLRPCPRQRDPREIRVGDALASLDRCRPARRTQPNAHPVEIWNRLDDLGSAARDSHRKVDEVRLVAELNGFRVASCWVLRATAANRALVARYPNVFEAEFPGSSRGWDPSADDWRSRAGYGGARVGGRRWNASIRVAAGESSES